MSCVISDVELRPIYSQALEFSSLLQKENPLKRELTSVVTEIITTLDTPPQKRSLQERIQTLKEIIHSFPSGKDGCILQLIEKIEITAELCIKSSSRTKVERNRELHACADQINIYIMQNDMHRWFQDMWAMISTVSRVRMGQNDSRVVTHEDNRSAFNKRMDSILGELRLLHVKVRPVAVIGQLYAVQGLVGELMNTHEQTSCLLTKKRKRHPSIEKTVEFLKEKEITSHKRPQLTVQLPNSVSYSSLQDVFALPAPRAATPKSLVVLGSTRTPTASPSTPVQKTSWDLERLKLTSPSTPIADARTIFKSASESSLSHLERGTPSSLLKTTVSIASSPSTPVQDTCLSLRNLQVVSPKTIISPLASPERDVSDALLLLQRSMSAPLAPKSSHSNSSSSSAVSSKASTPIGGALPRLAFERTIDAELGGRH